MHRVRLLNVHTSFASSVFLDGNTTTTAVKKEEEETIHTTLAFAISKRNFYPNFFGSRSFRSIGSFSISFILAMVSLCRICFGRFNETLFLRLPLHPSKRKRHMKKRKRVVEIYKNDLGKVSASEGNEPHESISCFNFSEWRCRSDPIWV